jgi:hypothetical protein
MGHPGSPHEVDSIYSCAIQLYSTEEVKLGVDGGRLHGWGVADDLMGVAGVCADIDTVAKICHRVRYSQPRPTLQPPRPLSLSSYYEYMYM